MGGILSAGHARKNSPCGGMRGRSRSRRTPAAAFFYPLESAQAPMMSWQSNLNTATTLLLLFTAFLVSAREPLTSAFDSARVPNVGGEGPRALSSHLLKTKPLSLQYRILRRLHKPQIPQLNLGFYRFCSQKKRADWHKIKTRA